MLDCAATAGQRGAEKGLNGRSPTGTVSGGNGVIEHDSRRGENPFVAGGGQPAVAQSGHGTEHGIIRALGKTADPNTGGFAPGGTRDGGDQANEPDPARVCERFIKGHAPFSFGDRRDHTDLPAWRAAAATAKTVPQYGDSSNGWRYRGHRNGRTRPPIRPWTYFLARFRRETEDHAALRRRALTAAALDYESARRSCGIDTASRPCRCSFPSVSDAQQYSPGNLSIFPGARSGAQLGDGGGRHGSHQALGRIRLRLFDSAGARRAGDVFFPHASGEGAPLDPQPGARHGAGRLSSKIDGIDRRLSAKHFEARIDQRKKKRSVPVE